LEVEKQEAIKEKLEEPMGQELVKLDLEKDSELLPLQLEEIHQKEPEKLEATKVKREHHMDQELVKPDLEEDSEDKLLFKY